MLKTEKKYEFRKRMLTIHKADIRDEALVPSADELVIGDDFVLYVPEGAADVAWTAARDFVDYMLISMNVSVRVKKGQTKGAGCLSYEMDAAMEKGYTIQVADGIHILCDDERSYAQAIYALEKKMSWRKAPYLKKETTEHKILFSPRMLHSGYELDKFPNEHLSAIAHSGRDAIMVFTKGVNLTPCGFVDFNELIYRASKYGIDVYAYSYLKSPKHPDDPDAQAYYDSTYGELFKNCPGLKGVVLVGESVEFPSKDPNVSGTTWRENNVENIPTGKRSPGWWPCIDYPRWLEVVMKSIKKYREDADIVFWTYNWGWAPKEERIRLIKSLPEGVSLNVTYEMMENIPLNEHSIKCDDYTLSFEGPGQYFVSEAIAAKERGIRLYAMTNTGGMSWDFGVTPYQPMPYQWMKRLKGIMEANEKWGLCGLMESHHYGFWPSFIGEFTGKALEADGLTMEEKLAAVLEQFYGAENLETVDQALKLWSEAITHYIPSNGDQYCAFRVGPSYPFNLFTEIKMISDKHAHFGAGIMFPRYYDFVNGMRSLSAVSRKAEIASLEQMKELMEGGLALLKNIPAEQVNEELEYLINLGEFISCMVTTGIHSKQWHTMVQNVNSNDDKEAVKKVLDEMEVLLKAEIANAEKAIPLVERDSRLGWEPSMEYLGDADHIRWKIRQVNYVLEHEIPAYRRGAEF